ncbi:thiamine-phosphate pyrophosphorylase [Friedmanniella endophytica]|uniref:Thiamine-phosphate synthase n=1 Tax=Microlunatus kandeliicorticis TaxID=1759536 RepID=A0A7W3IT55_9ACTN|nr:thiamine phosphate synthase [Microlunatus kandeliicorticis]MBA8794786.1 thiamine-phosphate pyrophosphorylase [Microlunatus kandeliicorticis]
MKGRRVPRSRLRAVLRLCLVTDAALCGDRGVPAVVRAAVAGGVTSVQVRVKDGSDRDRLAQVRAVQHALHGTGVPLLVDDAVDVAVLAGADGVHLGQSDLPVEEVRRWLGPDLIIGLSVSSVEQASASECAAADYLGIGPVWATATKPDAAVPLGPEGLARVAASAGRPAVAIGGITAARLPALRGRGLDGVCTVSEVCAAPDPAVVAARLRAGWDGGRR